MNTDKVKAMMNKYGITEAEAIEMLADDEAVDKMKMSEVNNDLTDEQKKAVKATTQTTSGKKKTVNRKKKMDVDKARLIKMFEVPIFNFPHEVVNEEREIAFTYNGAEYSITLTKHRPEK